MWKQYFRCGVVLLALALATAGCSGQTPDKLMAEARAAMAANQPRTAQIHLKNLLRDDPDNAAARSLLGEVSMRLGDANAAEANFRRAVTLGADPASVQIPLLQVLIGQGKFRDALRQIASGPRLEGAKEVTQLRLSAAAHRGLDDPEAAAKDYEAAIKLDPNSLETKSDLAAFRLEQQRYADARDLVIDVLARQPDFGPALLVRGRLDLVLRQYADAAETFRQIIKAEGKQGGEYFPASIQLADALLGSNSLDEAQKVADRLLGEYPRNPAVMVVKASVEVRQGKLDDARQRLETLVAAMPKFGPANRLLGTINARQGRDEQARMYLNSALSDNAEDGRAILQLAALDLKKGDLNAAKKQISKVVKSDKPAGDAVMFALAGLASMRANEDMLADLFFRESASNLSGDPEELVNVSRVYAASGEVERAQSILEKPSNSDSPKAWMASYLLALTQIGQRDFKAADVTAQRLIKQQPKAAWPHNLRGLVAVLNKNLDDAKKYYDTALKVDPKYLPALLNLSRVNMLQGKGDAAADDLKRVLAITPNQPAALMGLAQLALAQKNYKEAMKWAEQAPVSADQLTLQAMIEQAQGKIKDAAGTFASVFKSYPSSGAAMNSFRANQVAGLPNPEAPLVAWVTAHPRDPGANFVLAGLELAKGDQTKATARYEMVLASTPNNAAALNNLAWLYGQQGNRRALDYAKRAHEAAPKNPEIADTYGWLQVQLGDAKAGLALLEDSHKTTPDNPVIYYHWAAALAKTGSRDKAADELQKLLADNAKFDGRSDAQKLLDSLK